MNARDEERLRALLLEFFEPFATSIQRNFTELQEMMDEGFAELRGEIAENRRQIRYLSRRMDNMDSTISEIRIDVRGLRKLKEDVTMLKEDVTVLKKDVAILKEDVAVLKEDDLGIDDKTSRRV